MPGSTSTSSTPPFFGEPTTLATREIYRNNWMVVTESDLEQLAQRELREETGYRAADVHNVGWIDVAPGFVDQTQHVFLMRDITAGEAEQEETEADIRWRWWPVTELKTALRDSQITDAQALAAWTLVEPYLEF